MREGVIMVLGGAREDVLFVSAQEYLLLSLRELRRAVLGGLRV